ncbi:unnamed protein product [Caretta caretta]
MLLKLMELNHPGKVIFRSDLELPSIRLGMPRAMQGRENFLSLFSRHLCKSQGREAAQEEREVVQLRKLSRNLGRCCQDAITNTECQKNTGQKTLLKHQHCFFKA